IGRGAARALPSLTGALQDPDPFVRAQAAESVGRIGPHARGAVPDLIRAYGTGDPEVSAAVTAALVKVGADAVPPLVEALKSQREAERRGAAEALCKLGRAAVLGLIPALKDPDATCRRWSAQVLQGMGQDAREAVPNLTDALKDQDGQVRLAALKAV